MLTDRDGSYRIAELAAGTYKLTVTYGGLDTDKQTVTVKAGATTTQDFAMTSGIYKLDKFVVASEVEGNAAQVNKQKKADIFMTAISADSLGEVPDGNIGEFLRYVPGLQVNYVNADASTVSVRGQDPEATTFTIDGQIPAAAGTPPRSSTGSSDQSVARLRVHPRFHHEHRVRRGLQSATTVAGAFDRRRDQRRDQERVLSKRPRVSGRHRIERQQRHAEVRSGRGPRPTLHVADQAFGEHRIRKRCSINPRCHFGLRRIPH